MRIDRVGYVRLRSFGNYENEQISAEAVVEPGELPAAALEALQTWVNHELNTREQSTAQRDRAIETGYQISDRQNELERLNERLEKAKAFLVQHGVDTSDWLPF